MTNDAGFVLFGTAHLVSLAIIALACAMLPLVLRQIRSRGWSIPIAYVCAVMLVVFAVVKPWVWATQYGVPWQRLLPLQICDASVLLCALMLFLRSYRLYEVVYFWAMAGSVVAMITPELLYAFPNPIFILFFLGHGSTVISVLYATFAFDFRPRLRSILTALGVTALYALAIFPLNFALGTNYLFLLAKPAAPSILDYLGPWPWYLPGLFVLTIVAFCLCYAPFAAARHLRSRQ